MHNPFDFINERISRLEQIELENNELLKQIVAGRKHNSKKPATRKEAAEYLGISLPTLDKLEDSGALESFHVGRQKRFSWPELERYCNGKKSQS